MHQTYIFFGKLWRFAATGFNIFLSFILCIAGFLALAAIVAKIRTHDDLLSVLWVLLFTGALYYIARAYSLRDDLPAYRRSKLFSLFLIGHATVVAICLLYLLFSVLKLDTALVKFGAEFIDAERARWTTHVAGGVTMVVYLAILFALSALLISPIIAIGKKLKWLDFSDGKDNFFEKAVAWVIVLLAIFISLFFNQEVEKIPVIIGPYVAIVPILFSLGVLTGRNNSLRQLHDSILESKWRGIH